LTNLLATKIKIAPVAKRQLVVKQAYYHNNKTVKKKQA
jgi:hypothetical protein